ncbi:hypothetical protein NCCP1664_11720 [Zafaria cholistanensis]|uniref:Uncharacterized protein n=1 Tax=Zafaria cholistanensis TaxID=1682741 RepID=A0A5A7NPG5_9MICC|nr:right-handed parallel beta-helix repeat-containing protein [Zafaria cholistanensis]GER22675.1 hypothetical protein NCCP1664_11720 [Zafaria cholistanensis]
MAVLAAAATLAAGFTATAPADAAGTTLAQDSFTRTAAAGWGKAAQGGTWSSAAGLSVNNGAGKISLAAGQGRTSTLSGLSQANSDTTVTATLDKLPSAGAGYLYVTGRQVGADQYRAKVRIQADGSVRVEAARVVGGAEKAIASRTIDGLKYSAGQKLNIRVKVTGSAPTTVSAKAWAAGASEPAAWQATGTDTAPSLQKSGSIALGAYVSGSARNAPITATYDNLQSLQAAAAGSTPVQAPSVPPVAKLSTGTPSSSTNASRTSLVAGTYKPAAGTTGVPDGLKLTPYNTGGADLVITKDGTVLDGLEIWGDIKVRAKNVTIKNSRLHGGNKIPSGNTGIIDATNANVSNLVVQDSTLDPQRPSYYRDGIVGHDYTALRNEIAHTNDGLGIFNRPGGPTAANVTASGNYIHTLTFWSNDPAHSDGTHNDGIQVQGGTNIKIVGNTIDAFVQTGSGSARSPRHPHAGIGILLQQNVSKLGNVVVEDNYVDGGQTSINIDHTASKQSNITVTVRENNLGRNQFDFGGGSKYPIRIIKKSASTVTGLFTNRWADTKVALTESKTGGIRFNS